MENLTIKIPVIKLIQQEKTIYVGKLSGKQLLDFGMTTEWDPNLEWDLSIQGYQRAPNKKHYTRIAEFLRNESNPLLPTSALLAARELDYGILTFEPINGLPDVGELTIRSPRRLYIVDYQHRWRGLEDAVNRLNCAHLLDFQIPVIIMANVSKYEEIRQFYLINSKQKKVDTDLGLALLQTLSSQATEKELLNFVGPGNRYRIRATRLTFQIASLPLGPWSGKIIDPNMEATGNQIISIKSFVDSLRPLLTRTSPVNNYSDEKLIEIILDYWRAIETIIPEAFIRPKDYTLQGTIGTFVMHRVAAKIIFKKCKISGDFTIDNIVQMLKMANTHYFTEDFWRIGGTTKQYSSGGGVSELADLIIGQLQ